MALGLDGEVVLEGSWLYAGTTRYRIAIVRRGSRYGSGDYEDPPEVAQDREAATFEVWYTAAGDPERFAAGGGQYPSLDAARSGAETACGPSVRWEISSSDRDT
jgi:hypothetical protein